MEWMSADAILPIISLFGAVSVGTYYALKAPANAERRGQLDAQADHIEWLDRAIDGERAAHARTRNRLSRALDKLADEGIDYEDKEDSNLNVPHHREPRAGEGRPDVPADDARPE